TKIKILTVAVIALAVVGLSLGGLAYATLAPNPGTEERSQPTALSAAVQRPAAEQKAIAALQAVGGHIITDQTQPGEPVIGVYLLSRQFTEGDLRYLKEFRNLKTLILPRIIDAAMKELRELKGLERLRARDDGRISVVNGLGELVNLRELDLGQVEDAGLQ